MSRVLYKNAALNLLKLAASSVVAVLLPPFLVRYLAPEEYSAWVLVLQLCAYVSLFDAGVQTALGHFVAYTTGRAAYDERNEIVGTALVALTIACLASLIALAVGIQFLPQIFPQLPTRLVHDSRIAILVIGSTFAIGLPVATISGVFIGLQQNQFPVSANIVGKVTGAAAALWVLLHRGTLVQMAVAIALATLASHLMQLCFWRRYAAQIPMAISLATKRCALRFLEYCSALNVWTLGMLLVSGLDIVIVGKYDFEATAFYAIAASITGFLLSFQGAIFSAVLPEASVLHSRNDAEGLWKLLVSTTKYGTFLLLAFGVPLVLYAKPILTLWVGAEYSRHSYPILRILMVANVVRLIGLPYATVVLGTGQQRRIIMSPILEALVNFCTSIFLVRHIGSIGVAYGTLIGALTSISLHFIYNMPRTKDSVAIHRPTLLLKGVALPIVAFTPVCIAILAAQHVSVGSHNQIATLCMGIALSGILIYRQSGWYHSASPFS